MNMKSLLFAAVVALCITSFAETASAGSRYRGGNSCRTGYSRVHVQPYYRSYAPIRAGYYYNNCAPRYYSCAPRYYAPRCYSGYPAYSGYGYGGYYGGGVALRVGPVYYNSGHRGYCR